MSDGVELGPADRALLGSYGLRPQLISHYDRKAAFEHKVAALIGRSETQARDVFDLDLLLAGSAQIDASALDAKVRSAAAERALSVDFATFKSQVLAYLTPEQRRGHDAAEVWEQLVLRVVAAFDVDGKP
jgi:hypothetical protein